MIVPLRLLGVTVLTSLSLVAASGTASAQPGGPGGTFSDDNGSTHEGYIEAIVAERITSGCGTGGRTYCPGSAVTRDQMATFLSRALQLPPASRDFFGDDAGSVHEENINRVAEAGITLGDGQNRFSPRAPVRRDQMASFLTRAFTLAAAPQDRFTDDTRNTHEASINAVAAAGITQGCATTQYCPATIVQRGQMAAFLGRALGLQPRPVQPVVFFGSGQQRVDVDIPGGTYRNSDSRDGCYWVRVNGFGGTFEEINANGLVSGRTLVTVAPGDKGFTSQRCGTWTNDLNPITVSPVAPFTTGTFLVGPEVQAGTWRADNAEGSCYWERLSGFSGEFEETTANDFVDAGPVTVEIASDDVGFSSARCGTWTRQG